ncbi:MAG: DUF5977 domain-containing protein [Sediminibacterium sp.]|nr:DUF5977 domain-containing protein [Sediminibacterium sp.]
MNGQNYANINGSCISLYYNNNTISATFTKNNCPIGSFSEEYTHTILPNTVSSSISINDANNLAQTKLNTDGQNIANTKNCLTTNNSNIASSNTIKLTDTKGALSVSNSGDAVYSIVFPTPIGIVGVAPSLALTYSSGSTNGIAGYGWNITGLSSISRAGKRLDLDGDLSPIRGDTSDRLIFDGQRLIIKTGFNLMSGSTYQTEFYSNLRIEYNNDEFVVYYPNGTRGFYGSSTNYKSPSEWLLYRWVDAQGNYIDYHYSQNTYNNAYCGTNRIDSITWGQNLIVNTNFRNKIEFIYSPKLRSEFGFLNNSAIISNQLLNTVNVYCNNNLYRKFALTHETITGNYQRLIKVQGN